MSVLYLIRGLPGTGKSTLAKELGVPVFAADDWFVGDDGVYRFNPRELPQAHQSCQEKVRRALEVGSVAVANTFTQRWELEPYLAMEYDRLFVIDLFDNGRSDAELAARNEHGVPEQSIATMRARYEHDWGNGNPIPPWER